MLSLRSDKPPWAPERNIDAANAPGGLQIGDMVQITKSREHLEMDGWDEVDLDMIFNTYYSIGTIDDIIDPHGRGDFEGPDTEYQVFFGSDEEIKPIFHFEFIDLMFHMRPNR